MKQPNMNPQEYFYGGLDTKTETALSPIVLDLDNTNGVKHRLNSGMALPT